MASIPGLNAEVYFGDTRKPPPDWRAAAPDDEDDEDDEDDVSPERRKHVAAILGFDPMDDDEDAIDGAEGLDGGNPWQPFHGPRGGRGWRHAETGEVVYQEERPQANGPGGAQARDGEAPAQGVAGSSDTRRQGEAAMDEADAKAESLIAKGRAALASLVKLLDESTADRPVLSWVNAAVKWVGEKTQALYGRLEERYGRTTAISVFASGTAVAWGVTGASYALTGVPLAFPGMGTVCMLPGLAAAELYLKLRGTSRMGLDDDHEPSAEDVRRLAEWAAEELRDCMREYARQNPFPPSRWDSVKLSIDDATEERAEPRAEPHVEVAEKIRRKVRALAKKKFPPGSA